MTKVRNSPPIDGEQAGEHVGGEFRPVDRHARHEGGLLRGADGIGRPADRRAAVRDPDDEDHRRERDQARRQHAENAAGQGVGERPVDVAARRRAQNQREAEEDRAGGDGRHDRLQPADDDDEAVERAAGEARSEHAGDAERRRPRPSRRRSTDARQLVSTNTAPTERSMPGGDHDEGLRHRHQGEQHALVGRGLDDVGAEAGRMVAA